MSMRHYLFPSAGEPLRLSGRLVNGLTSGNDTLPDYAGSRQRMVSVFLEVDAGKPTRIARTEASIWVFDEEGSIADGLFDALRLGMESFPTPNTDNDRTVVAFPRTKRRKLEQEYRWEPDKAHIAKIIADIWPKRTTDRLKALKGTSIRKPPLSFEARRALSEASAAFSEICRSVDSLKEPSLKAFAFESRKLSKEDPDFAHLYRAVADISDWQLEVLRRKRTGKGVWYAHVEVMSWREGFGEAIERYSQRCESRNDAILAARVLLSQHAEKFGDAVTVEAELLTDLEWERRSYPD